MTTNEQKMCGFVGLFDIRQKSDALRTQVLKMSKNIRHRGPDWSGVYCGKRAILSHERLSIVDPQSGGLFNLKGVERIRDVQKQAVEESRLGIPLLFGMDVIHGYETVFPIPLGLSCTWNMKAIEESARIAAIEASADGICWTFSPMVDVSRDPRWGRVSEGNGEDPFLGAECRSWRLLSRQW